MPRINNYTPVNWLMALMLERKHTRRWTYEDLSKATGIPSGTLRNLFGKDPWSWKRETRRTVCRALGISEEQAKETFSL